MVGSSQSVATPNTYLNTAVAQVLSEFACKLEKHASGINEAIQEIVKESYNKHRRVVFNGNGYSDEWVKEAASRGLPNVKNAADALSVLTHDETVSLFENHNVLTREELESRYHIFLEKYSKQINIEAGVTVDIARRYIFPAASSFAGSLAANASALAAIGANNTPQERLARKISGILSGLYDDTAKLEAALAEARGIDETAARTKAYCEIVSPCMNTVRAKADALEKIVAKDYWPMPGYEELLFKL